MKSFFIFANRGRYDQAFRAYNQALGRCIRHKHDYASIFLVDARFCMHTEAAHNRSMVSKWMRNYVQHFQHPRESVGTVGEFFDRHGANPPGPPPNAEEERSAKEAGAANAASAAFGVSAEGGFTAEMRLLRGARAAAAAAAAAAADLPSAMME